MPNTEQPPDERWPASASNFPLVGARGRRWPVRLDPVTPPSLRKTPHPELEPEKVNTEMDDPVVATLNAALKSSCPALGTIELPDHSVTDTAEEDIKANPTTSWRDLIKVHPAADLLPMMSEEELRALGEDIKAYGMAVPITLTQYDGTWVLLDGRNRLDALELVGVKFALSKHGMLTIDGESGAENGEDMLDLWLLYSEDNPYARVKSLNIERRQLTTEQKREIAAKLLKVEPERSNRAIAEQVKLDKNTVQDVRQALEASGEIHQSETRVSTSGQKRKPAKKATTRTAAEPKAAPAVEEPRAPEQPKGATTDDLRTWIDLKPALPMSELFTALWDCMSDGERLTVHELVASDEWRSSRPRAIDRQPQQNRP
jgi:hypothetical protein